MLGRRQDGYHNLQTVFQILDYGDEIYVHKRQDGDIIIQPELVDLPLEKNLAYKSASALKEFVGDPTLGASINMLKRLPIGGGIGGGSSDAASTLVALNKVWNTGLNIEQLVEIGAPLGADIPIFIRGHSAWAEGTGDQLRPVELPEKWYAVFTPNCRVSTKAIFSHKDLTRNTPAITIRTFFEKGGKNDCQPLVTSLFPQVKDTIDWLNQYSPAKMTGTGASVFAGFSSEEEAQKVFSNRPKHINGFVAKGLNQSPLLSYLPE